MGAVSAFTSGDYPDNPFITSIQRLKPKMLSSDGQFQNYVKVSVSTMKVSPFCTNYRIFIVPIWSRIISG